ncbi:spirocyclase AveC family protein [Pseudomonas sp. CG7]|uniref:spirocyclase AveC family protein n=1 Tax=Pseudomonas sp. CG7 TaxID=191007 RepID=UPI00203369F9|nr:spirocyclase AveC family protein [Pseudomonas sp. CG7]MCM2459309.1 spirocyclase AveC family protein [Pseudomonas sp. CG7]
MNSPIHKGSGRLELMLTVLVIGAIVGGFVSMTVTGPEGLANPHPVGTYVYDGVPRALPPMAGIENMPAVFQAVGVLLALALWAWFGVKSWREGRMHPVILVMASITVMAVLMEPLINWGMYLSFDPRSPHLPIATPWMRIAPNIEPLSCFYGYPFYFLIPAMIANGVYASLVRRVAPDHYITRHPLWSLAVLGWVIGMVFDFAVELPLLRSSLYIYSQVWPAISIDVGKTWQFPALLAVPTIAVTMGWCAVLLHRDAAGLTLTERMALRLPGLRRMPTFGSFLLASVLACFAYSVYTGAFFAVRTLGLATAIAQPWPFEDQRIYDPDGLYRAAGVDGPFYDDIAEEKRRN